MSVGTTRWFRRATRASGLAAGVLLLIALAGCAADRASQRPQVPDEQLLAPATQALDTAVQAHAEQFAPRSMDAARRRITLARDILFNAAQSRRSLTHGEQDRVDALVAAARLDAREALTETQAKAVATQIDRLEGRSSDDSPSPDNNADADGGLDGPVDDDGAAGDDTDGPGLSAPDDDNALEEDTP